MFLLNLQIKTALSSQTMQVQMNDSLINSSSNNMSKIKSLSPSTPSESRTHKPQGQRILSPKRLPISP